MKFNETSHSLIGNGDNLAGFRSRSLDKEKIGMYEWIAQQVSCFGTCYAIYATLLTLGGHIFLLIICSDRC